MVLYSTLFHHTKIITNIVTETLALISRVLATVTSREEDNVLQDDKPIVYQNLWDIQPFKPSSYWFLNTGEAFIHFLYLSYVLCTSKNKHKYILIRAGLCVNNRYLIHLFPNLKLIP